MSELWEILVPTNIGNKKPARTRHHKEWDKYVRNISGGLTVLKPAKGQWIYENKLYEERVIPCRVVCTEKEILRIVKFTIRHYKQIAVMAYRISDKVIITYANK